MRRGGMAQSLIGGAYQGGKMTELERGKAWKACGHWELFVLFLVAVWHEVCLN